ncbi:MAG: hypothetical protein D6772_06405 [Bacteroidetes bacterium]|nr:MAG: hypothetical protein D6772_06405 [Bacteroidota bacterium]
MKNSIFLFFVTATILALASCGERTITEDETNVPLDPASTPIYATPTEAADQAKADLLAILQQQPDLNLGIDAETLSAATAAAPIAQQQLNFNRLLNADSSASLTDLVQEALPTVVPFRTAQQVVTVASIVPADNGWQLAELAGQGLTQDLNSVMAATQASAGNIRILQVPNLQATIFAVDYDGYTSYHTRYKGMPIEEGLDEAYLLNILTRDARRFEEEFGAEVRQQQLVR